MIRIPNHIVKNEKFKLDNKSFVLYAYLKFLEFRSYVEQGEEFTVLHKGLMQVIGVRDNRTLKACFKSLYDNDLLSTEITDLTKNKTPITIKLINNENTDTDKYFTQLPSSLFYRLNNIGHFGFRLMYYYESYIDRKKMNKDKAYPSQQTIKNDLKCSYSSIDKYNKLLVAAGILKVKSFDTTMNGYDILDNPLFHRYNNHYFVRLDKI